MEKVPTIVMVGSVFKKELINFTGYLREDVRSGEDIDWSLRIKNLNLQIKYPTSAVIEYRGLEKKSFKALVKYFTYGLLSAKVDILRLYRAMYFYTICLLPCFLYSIGTIFLQVGIFQTHFMCLILQKSFYYYAFQYIF